MNINYRNKVSNFIEHVISRLQQPQKKNASYLALSTLALGACGGGGGENQTPNSKITIDGNAIEGSILNLNTSRILDPDGLGPISINWLRDGKIVNGATSEEYTLSQEDVGKNISAKITYVDGAGNTETLSSSSTSNIKNINDYPTGSITISGAAEKGSTLLLDTSSLKDEDGLGELKIVWKADGEIIVQENSSSLLLRSLEVGKIITAEISYTDNFGKLETVSSASTAVVQDILVESLGALSVKNTGTQNAQILEFYLDNTQDKDGDGVTSLDVILNFDVSEARFTSFEYSSGFVGAANESAAATGKIIFGAIALSGVSTNDPLFTMKMEDLDSTSDYAIIVSDLMVDGIILEGSTLIV